MMIHRFLDLELPKGQSCFLWGARKTGKSTYLKQRFPDSLYIDLLRADICETYLQHPERLREELKTKSEISTIIIDEVQKIPPLLDEVHQEPLSFDESIKMLCGDQSPNEKQEQILNSLKAYVENRATDEDKKVVAHFHNWAINIHNSNLTVPEGASGFPNNIVYSIIQALRNSNSKDELTSEEVLMLFMLEGINARKISGGETPGTNFISTILLNQVLKSANFEDKKTQEFISKYGLDNDLVKQYNSFMSSHFKNSWINTYRRIRRTFKRSIYQGNCYTK